MTIIRRKDCDVEWYCWIIPGCIQTSKGLAVVWFGRVWLISKDPSK